MGNDFDQNHIYVERHWIYVNGVLVYDSLRDSIGTSTFALLTRYVQDGANHDVKYIVKKRHVPLVGGSPYTADWDGEG